MEAGGGGWSYSYTAVMCRSGQNLCQLVGPQHLRGRLLGREVPPGHDEMQRGGRGHTITRGGTEVFLKLIRSPQQHQGASPTPYEQPQKSNKAGCSYKNANINDIK